MHPTSRSSALTGVSAAALLAVAFSCSTLPAHAQALTRPQGAASASAAAQASAPRDAALQAADSSVSTVGEIVVTAQKRSQSINAVGMSITAATGEQLTQRGITDTSQLSKLVPGFTFNETAYGTPVYTIRGVGFQENTLAASPAVSIYEDEIPLPFSEETQGAVLDLQRVEVLKGPQGTLYGENSTGGAINYISAKPTNSFQAGVDASYGRFNTADVQGFVGGPITDTLTARLSARAVESSNWQQSYTTGQTLGAQNELEGRLLLDWTPISHLKVSINLNAWQDRSDDAGQQFEGIHEEEAGAPLAAGLVGYPIAPANDRAADWNGGERYHRDNIFYQGSARIDYTLPHDLTLTSLTAYERYTRNQPVDEDGTTYEDFRIQEGGSVSTVFQELRLSGLFSDKGSWIVGANYESDNTFENLLQTYPDSTVETAIGFPDNRNTSRQDIKTYAVFGNFEHQLVDTLSLQGGVRFTETDRDFVACSGDAGDGKLAAFFNYLEPLLNGGAPVTLVPPGGCSTFNAQIIPGPVYGKLDQSNVSWRTSLNWKPRANTLLYVSVSKGYKSGSFPTLSASTYQVFAPVTQESVLAYEGGFKAGLLDGKLQFNGAGFYYDYVNKQVRGFILAEPFGNLGALVNIPKSHIAGFELSGTWRPLDGLTISPSVTMVQSRIDGDFSNYTPFSATPVSLSGEEFPYTPKWSGNVDAEYVLPISSQHQAFIGGELSYEDSTNGQLGDIQQFKIRSYILLDLRAGVQTDDGKWRLMVYGRNVTNQYYWTSANYVVDTVTRYAGQPTTYGVNLSYRFR